MGQTTSRIDEKEAVARMTRLSLDKNAYVFVDDDSCMGISPVYIYQYIYLRMQCLLHTRRATGSAPSLWTKQDDGKRSFCLPQE